MKRWEARILQNLVYLHMYLNYYNQKDKVVVFVIAERRTEIIEKKGKADWSIEMRSERDWQTDDV